MEHSFLHALEMTGLVVALGGVFFIMGLVRPARRALGSDPTTEGLAEVFCTISARWICRGALIASLAALLNILVDVGEVQGKTVYNGIDPSLVWEFSAHTTVGELSLAKVAALLALMLVALLPGNWKWWLTGAVGFGAVLLTSLVSHAAAQPTGRLATVAAQVAHTTAAALWVGVLIHLLAARTTIQGPQGQAGVGLISEIVRRFSPVALTVIMVLWLSGLYMLVRFLWDPGGVLTSAYGLTLIVKMLLLTPALYAGWTNFRVIKPALLALADAEIKTPSPTPALLRRFERLLELEATMGVMVILVAGILASVSPPGEEGAYRLTSSQWHAMLSPRIPTAKIANPASFYGADTRGLDDLHYSEFTHHWSGVMVGLLGLGWLAQGLGGRAGKWSGYAWPFLLVPFAIFVAVASDPEVWILRQVSFRQVIGDPQLLEHQLGAAMILILVWLGWRDHKKLEANRPLGYALPVILIVGGVLLLGHAHSTLTITEEVTNLINTQHAIFGMFILTAGVARWLSLRDLVPRSAANIVWPGAIIGLGVYMAFFYREVV